MCFGGLEGLGVCFGKDFMGVWGVCCREAGGGEIFLCVGVPGGAAAPQRWVSMEGR